MRLISLVILGLAIATPLTAGAEVVPRPYRLTAQLGDGAHQRFIVKRQGSSEFNYSSQSAELHQTTLGATLRIARRIGPNVELLEAERKLTQAAIDRLLRALEARADIDYAVLDRRRYLHAVPSDSLYASQWFLQDTQPAAIQANIAWDATTGGSGTVVAVLDTGVRFDHPDLQRAAQGGKLLPGYDFVSGESSSSFLAANDGNGWDADPSDPGDWIDSNDKQQSLFSDCEIDNSSWHGTRVAGLIGAASNNGIGVAGVSWGAYILPVRVLGKCGGYDSDILPAMRWAAGLRVSGVPDNPYPAKIINMSFGSADPCNAAYQSVLQELAAIGVAVIVSAGNEGGPVGSPANCANAIAVAGLRHAGTKVGYSSLGPEVAIAAPAGNCVNLSGACLFSLHTTYDIGRTTPSGYDYTDQFNTNIGTSFSAPLAAGVAALMHSVNTRLTATQLRARLQESARPFPRDATVPDCRIPTGPTDLQLSECNCTTTTCGAGMLSAASAVLASQRPIAAIASPASYAAGSSIALDAATSAAACNRSIASYRWEVVDASNTAPPALTVTDQSSLQVTAPLSGSYTLRVTVTDNQSATDFGDVVVGPTASATNAPPPPSGSACPNALNVAAVAPSAPSAPSTPSLNGGGSGGGALNMIAVFLLALMLGCRRHRRLI